MSNLNFATPQNILGWLKDLGADYRIIAPKKEGPSVVFREQTAEMLTDVESLLLRATMPPKEALMPKSEDLFSFSASKQQNNPAELDMKLEADTAAKPALIFGGRPCDAKGFVVLDRPYLQGKYVDPYYKNKREATLIITQACPTAYTACFCNWVGGSPSDSAGSDIVFTAVPNGFMLEAITDKGKELLKRSNLAPAADKEQLLRQTQAAAADSLPPASTLTNIAAKIAARFTDDAFWTKAAAGCISCGACTYLCPTCQCFTITDEGNPLQGKRIRSWDSCMVPRFTLEASGHNPRSDKSKRMRNRISHKFSYYPGMYQGEYSCCGCGRCVISCPVAVDIRRVVAGAVAGMEVTPDHAQSSAPESSAPETARPAAKAAAKPAAKTAVAKKKTTVPAKPNQGKTAEAKSAQAVAPAKTKTGAKKTVKGAV